MTTPTVSKKKRPTKAELKAQIPQLDGRLTAPGLDGEVTISRDAFGIPAIEAGNEHDAWFGMGYACAQDRLWQLEWYRRRGTGTWAEVAGPVGVASDLLFRRFLLDEASQADVAAMSPATLAMFEAYAAGVNAFIHSDQPLPIEYALTGSKPDDWEPWHSVLIFKVRHAIMGKRLMKLARTELLRRIGPEKYALLDGSEPVGLDLILPPGSGASEVIRQSAEELREAVRSLDTLGIDDGGSNSWAVHGSRTTTGKPMLVNDSHRPLDVPNVYWQVTVGCPEFRMAGGAFPGFPAFPHFGNNGQVAFNITHGQADYQDLYLESFDPKDPTRYRTESGWAQARVRRERVRVAGGDPVTSEVWVTRHGPVVGGDPRSGHAIAMRYTATDQPCEQWECLRPMLTARTVQELHETQRKWVEPVNNLVSADAEGNIGFLYRGRVPVRSTEATRQFVVPGWTGEHEWSGDVPFRRLPQAINPPEGFVGTANQRPIEGDDPYLAYEFAAASRAARVIESLRGAPPMTPAAIAALQGDRTSVAARRWMAYLATRPAMTGDAECARALLATGDGELRPNAALGLLYGCFSRALSRHLIEPIVGGETWAWMAAEGNTGTEALVRLWMYQYGASLEGPGLDTTAASVDGRPLSAVLMRALPRALADAWRDATRIAGTADPKRWRWDAAHVVRAEHTLSASFPELASVLDPPVIPIGGDSDTIQAAAVTITEPASGPAFKVGGLSVYRQVVDFTKPDRATWITPGGTSGLPGTPHYADQAESWRTHRRAPMHLRASDVTRAAETTLVLEPA
ncbi:MAG: penicillin acylase family protein [Chloroflexi bacterium]|nr:penicillin acylase family protein [Chloroflexota bacterium]MDA1146006.1 penicillin acylase family protein [Chloroflexota bacterium]